MSVLIPSKVITDLSKFDAGEFEDPKWIIMKNNAGLQLQMFWPNKSEEILSENQLRSKLLIESMFDELRFWFYFSGSVY